MADDFLFHCKSFLVKVVGSGVSWDNLRPCRTGTGRRGREGYNGTVRVSVKLVGAENIPTSVVLHQSNAWDESPVPPVV